MISQVDLYEVSVATAVEVDKDRQHHHYDVENKGQYAVAVVGAVETGTFLRKRNNYAITDIDTGKDREET